ncbi:MAG TPA: diaminopimelate epimerase [Nitriliruptorales bacterium]
MRYTKAHGTANDFVVLVDLDGVIDLPASLVRALCDRRLGIGADGVLRIGPGSGDADVFMDYRNADGSIVEMCGNGVRVVAKHVVDHALVDPDGDALVVGTRAGDRPVTVSRGRDGRVDAVTVDMGPPIWAPADVPFDADGDAAIEVEVIVDDEPVVLTAVSMGNPHAVLAVDDVDGAPVTTLGPRLEVHERFPKRASVSFAEVVDGGHVRLRVWERGVGETAACGTGACATAVSMQRLGRVGQDVAVELPGGVLRVRYAPGGRVMLTGPAVEVASGTIDEGWLASVAREGGAP